MKRGHFVEGLSNGQHLMAAIARAENRAAIEKNWVLIEGDVGYGKSSFTTRVAVQKNAQFVRAKAGWTKCWMLADIAQTLGLTVRHSTEELYKAIVVELMQRPRMLVIDEIDHVAAHRELLETLRDITDMTEIVLLAVGMKGARGLIKRYPQIFSRITEIVTFGPASVEDVKLMCAELTDVKIADGLAERIQDQTKGRLREVMDCIARVEAFGRKQRGPVTVELYGDRPLLTEDRKAANG